MCTQMISSSLDVATIALPSFSCNQTSSCKQERSSECLDAYCRNSST